MGIASKAQIIEGFISCLMTFGVHESGFKNKSSGAYAGRFDISIA